MTKRIGIDIGSTTLKTVVVDESNSVVFSNYDRHNAAVLPKLTEVLTRMREVIADGDEVKIHLTGSVGMGIAEELGLPFVQEVVAATKYITAMQSDVATMIDIGGEDAKVVIFRDGKADDLRMNGNCAGGTGAFIDQMAVLLGVPVTDLNGLAMQAEHIYPIASRCGVFCKTDIQNLIAKNVSKADIAASIFHAVTVQTVVTLAHGYRMQTPLMFIGGPLTFIPALRKAFTDYLGIGEEQVILPRDSQLIPAYGSALSDSDESFTLSDLIARVGSMGTARRDFTHRLEPVFTDGEEYRAWLDRKSQFRMKRAAWTPGCVPAVLGIDSGSTTTKIVALTPQLELLFSYYHVNDGNPIRAVGEGLRRLREEAAAHGAEVRIVGACSTGYGEDLIKAAFRLDYGIIETMAHYVAARQITPDVSFILDIGGQDMKAMYVNHGTISQVEINEACSSGCGSFISTFATSLGYTVADFARAACESRQPCDLGTRCTVFMNSKVKQVLREGATLPDIAAGLSYSVIKNCLYKVLKLKGPEPLGDHIVVQGGTMKNDSVVRAFEKLTGREVFRSEFPELMGAVGCACYAARMSGKTAAAGGETPGGRMLDTLLESASFETAQLQCHGCENNCLVNRYTFRNGNRYFSGNRCEKVFTNRGADRTAGLNAYQRKLELLFGQTAAAVPGDRDGAPTIGIPRVLNLYEEFPFWKTLFEGCGFRVLLSPPSTYSGYERGAQQVMSDNLCFPAKLVHSHIRALRDAGADRIFMPYVVFERDSGYDENSFNCPVVSGYSQVVKSVDADEPVPVDSPVISFRDEMKLYRQCSEYLAGLGIGRRKILTAFRRAVRAYNAYEENLRQMNLEILWKSRTEGTPLVLLAGRPYHSDPLIQHKLSDLIAAMGCNVITEDIVRDENIDISDVHFISQWSYPGRILRAAKWCARQSDPILFMQMTSFGCGPDAFLLDEVRDLLHRYGKSLTLLKIDDVNNIGSLKLRVRSALDSAEFNSSSGLETSPLTGTSDRPIVFQTTPVFSRERRNQKILAPFFTPFISPLIPAVFSRFGYDIEALPVSDRESDDYGLQFANNEICYPATLIVGDMVKAFKSGRYDPDNTSVVITQTGGQCRASNYISLIKKALVEAGFGQVSVISLSFSSGLSNEQPGFRINWFKAMPWAFWAVIYGDVLSKFYYAAKAREKARGSADEMLTEYIRRGKEVLQSGTIDQVKQLISQAALTFNGICNDKECPRVGIVGEIFLKFHPYAQKGLTEWLVERHIEVAPPLLLDFFMQSFVNVKVDKANHLTSGGTPDWVLNLVFRKIQRRIDEINRLCASFRYFQPFGNVFHEAEEASQVITLEAQYGEGWLLPAEIIGYLRRGITHVVSLQPFGCIANHIVSKGITNRLKRLYPELNLLSLDFDSGVSEVNVVNRLLLFTDSLRPSK